MCAYDNVYLACLKVGKHLLSLLRASCSRQIVHSYRHAFQSGTEGLIMLVGEHRGRHHYCHLLGVARRLEGCTDGDFCFSESDIAAYKTVHRTLTLHVCFHVVGSFQLVWGVFVKEACLQFVLHERISTELITFLMTARSIKLYQVAGYVFYLLLCLLLQTLPGSRAESAQAWRSLTVTPLIF